MDDVIDINLIQQFILTVLSCQLFNLSWDIYSSHIVLRQYVYLLIVGQRQHTSSIINTRRASLYMSLLKKNSEALETSCKT